MEGEVSARPDPAGPEPDRLRDQARVVVSDDLKRSRLTVFFRLLLTLPHLVWLLLWSVLIVFVAVANWFAVLFTTRPIAAALISRYLRYYAHVAAYLYLGANPFPGFTGEPGNYPVEVETPEPAPQSRLKAAFRLILVIPALLLASALGGGGLWHGDTGWGISFGVVAVASILAWFVAMAQGRLTQGLRDLIAYCVGYVVQVAAYLLLLTDRYPDSDPLRPDFGRPAPLHPARVVVADDLRRSRLTVFFRLLLALPHFVWILLWGIAVFFAVIANWFATLFAGRPAEGIHRFVSRYVRYVAHVSAFAYVIANPFPGFGGEEGTYPLDLQLPPPAAQNRWKTGFRALLAMPALLLAGTIGNALGAVAIFAWFTGLVLGRVPRGLRNLGAFAIRYNAQVYAYLLLLTDRYPFAGPSLEQLPAAEPAARPA